MGTKGNNFSYLLFPSNKSNSRIILALKIELLLLMKYAARLTRTLAVDISTVSQVYCSAFYALFLSVIKNLWHFNCSMCIALWLLEHEASNFIWDVVLTRRSFTTLLIALGDA